MPDDTAWAAPGSGRPLNPADIVAPSAADIADKVVRQITVPRGPKRSAPILLGITGNPNLNGKSTLAISAVALNSVITLVILPASGIISSIDFSAVIVSTGAAAGILQLIDGNSSVLRNFPISVGAAGSFNVAYSTDPDDLPFINGLTALWTPLVAAFGASVVNVNLDYRSIPVGQRTADNV